MTAVTNFQLPSLESKSSPSPSTPIFSFRTTWEQTPLSRRPTLVLSTLATAVTHQNYVLVFHLLHHRRYIMLNSFSLQANAVVQAACATNQPFGILLAKILDSSLEPCCPCHNFKHQPNFIRLQRYVVTLSHEYQLLPLDVLFQIWRAAPADSNLPALLQVEAAACWKPNLRGPVTQRLGYVTNPAHPRSLFKALRLALIYQLENWFYKLLCWSLDYFLPIQCLALFKDRDYAWSATLKAFMQPGTLARWYQDLEGLKKYLNLTGRPFVTALDDSYSPYSFPQLVALALDQKTRNQEADLTLAEIIVPLTPSCSSSLAIMV